MCSMLYVVCYVLFMIKISNLKKEYDVEGLVTKILRGISLEIKKGEFISIMGPSGSGKSTLMHILGLLDRATSGTYFFNKEDIADWDDKKLAFMRNFQVGFVFQSFFLLNRTNILDNVALPLSYAKNQSAENSRKRAKTILESVGLGHRLHHFPNQISGGEKQRVAISRALVNNPSIIFADEPTGNLDSKSGKQIMKIFSDLNKAGNTVVLVTHDINIAKKAKRIIKIKDGVIISDQPQAKS